MMTRRGPAFLFTRLFVGTLLVVLWFSFAFSAVAQENGNNLLDSLFDQYRDEMGHYPQSGEPSEEDSIPVAEVVETNQEAEQTHSLAIGDVFEFGHVYDFFSKDNEPIEWLVLDVAKEEQLALVISKYAIHDFQYNSVGGEETDWESSTIYTYLNSEFLNKNFDEAERSKIVDYRIQNKISEESNQKDALIPHMVFLLSQKDAVRFFTTPDSWKCQLASYSKDRMPEDTTYVSWWLQESEGGYALLVDENGLIRNEEVKAFGVFIRPALLLDIRDISFTEAPSSEDDGASSEWNEGEFFSVPVYVTPDNIPQEGQEGVQLEANEETESPVSLDEETEEQIPEEIPGESQNDFQNDASSNEAGNEDNNEELQTGTEETDDTQQAADYNEAADNVETGIGQNNQEAEDTEERSGKDISVELKMPVIITPEIPPTEHHGFFDKIHPLILLGVCAGIAVVGSGVFLVGRKQKSGRTTGNWEEPLKGLNSVSMTTSAIINEGTYLISGCLGQGKRNYQEDSLWYSEKVEPGEPVCAVIADGMGGMENGAESSATAINAIRKQVEHIPTDKDIPSKLWQICNNANSDVFRLNTSKAMNGGSTLIMVYIFENMLYWISVGDSRLFLYRDGMLASINEEHELETRMYSEMLDDEIDLSTVRDTPNNELRKLTSNLGRDSIPLIDQNFIPYRLMKGDKLLLCSDGISGTLDENDLLYCLEDPNPEVNCDKIVEMVEEKNKRGQDNYSAIVVSIETEDGK